MEQQRNDATQTQDNETPHTKNPTQHKNKKTTTPKGISTTIMLAANDDSSQETNKQPHDEDALHDNIPAHQQSWKTTATNNTLTSEQNQPSLTIVDNATQQQNNDSTKLNDDATQMNNNPTQNDTKKKKRLGLHGHIPGLIHNVLQHTLSTRQHQR